ncbi:hypothetical protein HYV72_01830, partial [Candidatus Uhrbacteria bacterium]|nr:hypothetical protein [Candidatus Uhrbacteria bacterium]
ARHIFTENRTHVDKLVEVLLEKETIEKEEFENIVGGKNQQEEKQAV